MLGGIPLELVTMLGSSLLGGFMTIWSQNMKSKQEAFQRAIDGLAAQSKATDEARRYENKGFQLTRRIIALSAIGAVIVWPKVVPVFWPDMPVIVGWTMKGLVITPLDTHLVSAITGLYFGASMVKNAK
jgi:hypothetical protein